MNWGFLSFLGEAWFVVPWYAVGLGGAAFVIHDMRTSNTALKPAMKWAWPIIVLFFSVIGLALYFATARAPGIAHASSEEERRSLHHRFERSSLRRTVGAVIHCVAGDGIGILSAMVIARAAGMSFWQEFWFEYGVGFGVGWLIFQRKSMTMMTKSLTKQLAMAFRSEFFSMLTVMGGMGAVMTYVTPQVATSQPKPLTLAFWGFGMLGLLVGFVFTYPMNWMVVKIGWKHGMGDMMAADEARATTRGGRYLLLFGMVVLGAAGLWLPAWSTQARRVASARVAVVATAANHGPRGTALFMGLNGSLMTARAALRDGNRTRAALAMDNALRAAATGAHAAPGSFYNALERIRAARLALQQGHARGAAGKLADAAHLLRRPSDVAAPLLDVNRYRGATVVNSAGAIIGDVASTDPDSLELTLGGWRDLWGVVDLGPQRTIRVTPRDVVFGPAKRVGTTLVMLSPTMASGTTTAED